jgi:hypothetical protein
MFYASIILITVQSELVQKKRLDLSESEMDKVLLPRKFFIVSTTLDKFHHGLIPIGIKLVRVNVIRVDFIILFFFAGYILLFLAVGRRCL